jgi:hypothetical protein
MITTITHAAAFVLPAAYAALTIVAAFGAFTMSKPAVAVNRRSVDLATGTGIDGFRWSVASYVPQSRGSTG